MGRLFDQIREAVRRGDFRISAHASARLVERGLVAWQIEAAMASARLLGEFPDAEPNPKAEVRQELPDGTAYKGVWSFVREHRRAKLVTVHFFDDQHE